MPLRFVCCLAPVAFCAAVQIPQFGLPSAVRTGHFSFFDAHDSPTTGMVIRVCYRKQLPTFSAMYSAPSNSQIIGNRFSTRRIARRNSLALCLAFFASRFSFRFMLPPSRAQLFRVYFRRLLPRLPGQFDGNITITPWPRKPCVVIWKPLNTFFKRGGRNPRFKLQPCKRHRSPSAGAVLRCLLLFPTAQRTT